MNTILTGGTEFRRTQNLLLCEMNLHKVLSAQSRCLKICVFPSSSPTCLLRFYSRDRGTSRRCPVPQRRRCSWRESLACCPTLLSPRGCHPEKERSNLYNDARLEPPTQKYLLRCATVQCTLCWCTEMPCVITVQLKDKLRHSTHTRAEQAQSKVSKFGWRRWNVD